MKNSGGMKKIRSIGQIGLIVLIGIFYFSFFPSSSRAAVNRQINYQGKLTNLSDVAVADGSYDFVIRIYDAESGGSCLWSARGSCVSPTARSVSVSKGIFSIMLGDTVAGDNALNLDFSSDTYYLGIKVSSDNEMAPRKRLGSVPQAVNALNVVGDGYIDIGNTLASQDAVNIDYNPTSGSNDAVEITYGSGGGTGTALKVTQSGSGDIVNIFDGTDEIFTVLNGGNVGIGNTNPGALLDIGSAGTTLGVIRLEGSTSGYAAIQPTAAAGNATITLPATTGIVALTSQLHTQNTDTGTDGTAFTIGDGSTTFTVNTGATNDSFTIEQGTNDSTLTFTQPGGATEYTFTTGGTVCTTGGVCTGYSASHTHPYLSNATDSTQSGYFGDVYLYDDSTPSHYLQITNSGNLTGAHVLSLNTNNVDRTVSLSGDLTVSSTASVSGTNTGDQFTGVTASTLLGRGSGSSGAAQEITLGTNLSMSGTTLNASGGSGPWTDGSGITYLTDSAEDLAVGAATLDAPFSVDESANTVRIGEGAGGSGTNAVLQMYGSDDDTGTITYNTSDTWDFSGGIVNVDSLTTDTNGITIASGASYTGSGAVTFSSASASNLTINSGTTGTIAIGDDASAEIINISTGAAAKTLTIGSTTTSSTTTIQSGTGGINLKAEDTAEGNVQIGTGGAGTNTPDLFVLDAKDNAGNPATAIEGAMFYSQSENKFKCYENTGWKDCDTTGASSSPTLRTSWFLYEDWRANTIAAGTGADLGNIGDNKWTFVSIGSGGTLAKNDVGAAASDQGRLGVIRLNSPATANTGASLRLDNTMMNGVPGNLTVEWDFASVTDNIQQTIRIGLHDSVTTAAPTDGIFFQYNVTTTAANWFRCTYNNGANTCTDTGIAKSAINVYQKFKIVTNAAGTQVDFYIDDVSAGSNTTNLPATARSYGTTINANTVNATIRQWKMDYFQLSRTGVTR